MAWQWPLTCQYACVWDVNAIHGTPRESVTFTPACVATVEKQFKRELARMLVTSSACVSYGLVLIKGPWGYSHEVPAVPRAPKNNNTSCHA